MKGSSLKKNFEQGERADNAWLKFKEEHGSREKSRQKIKLCIGQQKKTSHEHVNVVSGFVM